jgi:hypothetical protein
LPPGRSLVAVTDTVEDFAERAERLLSARLEYKVHATVIGNVRRDPAGAPGARRSGCADAATPAPPPRSASVRSRRGAGTHALHRLLSPVSNRIYRALGYRRFADWSEFAFER